MARRKVMLQYIENKSARKVTYNKRVKGLVKKTQELSILCGVKTCAIIYPEDKPSPVVWPTSETEARGVLSKYNSEPDTGSSERKLTQESFLKQTVTKFNDKIRRLRDRNREAEMQNVMVNLLFGKPIEQVIFCDLKDLTCVIEDRLRTFQHRVRVLESGDNDDNPSVSHGLNFNNTFDMQAGPSQLSHYQQSHLVTASSEE